MRLALILAVTLAACTGKNAAKGSVEYVPVVPLSAFQGAGGDEAEADAAVGGSGGAGGSVEAGGGGGGEPVEADAGGGGEPGGAVVEADAGDVVDALSPAMECADGPAFPAGEAVVFDADLEVGCTNACTRFVECAVGAGGLCPCLANAEPRPAVQSCMEFCMGTPDAGFRNAVGHDRACADVVGGAGDAVDAIGAACHGGAE